MALGGVLFSIGIAFADGARAPQVEHKGGADLFKERIILNLEFQYVLLCVVSLRVVI
jgi:hypothetical protein